MKFKNVLFLIVAMGGVFASVSNVTGQHITYHLTNHTEDSMWATRTYGTPGTLKLESSLRALLVQGDTGIAVPWELVSPVQVDSNNAALVYVYPDQNSSPGQVDSVLRASGDTTILAFDTASPVVLRVPVSNLATVAALPHVGYVRPALYAVSNAGHDHPHGHTRGDYALKSDIVRKNYGVTGKGSYIGLLSDDCDYGSSLFSSLRSAGADAIPYNFEVSDDSYENGVRTHEGLALADIIHDIAPDAGVVFAQGASDITSFASNIRKLATGFKSASNPNPHSCKIICDDLFYPEEPYFEDAGGVWQAIHDVVTKDSVFYVTSAGNFARDVYSFDSLPTGTFHDTTGSYTLYQFPDGHLYDPIYVPSGATLKIALQWDDHPFAFAQHIYNIFLYDIDANKIVYRTSTPSAASTSALQTLDFINNESGRHFGVMVERESQSAPAGQKFVLFIYNSDRLSPPYFHNGIESVMGHAESADVLACAAISAFNEDSITPANSWKARSSYSSTGPVSIYGHPERQKPDKAFIDQVSTEVPGFYIFSGTSASAAHAAGIAALIRSYRPSIGPWDMLNAIRNPGAIAATDPPNNELGYGRADALQSFLSLPH